MTSRWFTQPEGSGWYAPASGEVTESREETADVVVLGGGHNALVAATYLARAGLDVVLLERLDHVGGAAVSARTFPEHDARLSRYSYLVSLMPEALVKELGLDLELRSRGTASYTPYERDGEPRGLLVETDEGDATRASFRALTGDDDAFEAWQAFYGEVGSCAAWSARTGSSAPSRRCTTRPWCRTAASSTTSWATGRASGGCRSAGWVR